MTDDGEALIKTKNLITLPRIIRKNMKFVLSRYQGQLFLMPHPTTITKDETPLSEIFMPF